MSDDTPITVLRSPELEALMEDPENTVLVPSAVLYDRSLSFPASILWQILADYKDAEDCVSMSLRELAKLLNGSTDTVRRAVENLEQQGYLAVERRVKAKSTYQLLLHGERIEWPEAA